MFYCYNFNYYVYNAFLKFRNVNFTILEGFLLKMVTLTPKKELPTFLRHWLDVNKQVKMQINFIK